MTSPGRAAVASVASRIAVLASLGLVWINFLTTARWAQVPGALHGSKQWIFVATLVVTSIVALRPWRPPGSLRLLSQIAAIGGLAVLCVSFFVWFPPATWSQIPFLDNWPARYQSTLDGLALYRQGAVSGWEWHFLGGYHSSSDLTVTLSALAALPVALFGPAPGFHLVHLLLLLAIPGLIGLDLWLGGESRPTILIATGLVSLTVTGWFSYYLARSGDTNSLAGTVCALAALTGSHAAARDRLWGGCVLVVAMALVNYSHAGFFLYAAILLVVEAAFYRDRRRLLRAGLAIAAGAVAGLPLTWETWRYPAYFTFNNVTLEAPPFLWGPFLRKVYYNVEIMFLPWRWFNDFTGLTGVLTPVIVLTAWRGGERSSFHAWAALTATALLRLNTPELGYAFLRPVHLLAVFPAVAIAEFLVRSRLPAAVTASTIALCAVYLQYLWVPVPHVPQARALNPALVDHLRSSDGAMILIENTFHRDMDADPQRQTEPAPFPAHLEGLLPVASGKRFYAGVWDGWQWSPFRANLLSGGAFRGQAISEVAKPAFIQEMRRWGIKHVVVWSAAATAYLREDQDLVERWRDGTRWIGFEVIDADTREVVTPSGHGRLAEVDPLGAAVVLEDVRQGALVIVRTNYFPAWSASAGGVAVPLFGHDGQLAFLAPAAGSYSVRLEYPRRHALLLVAALALIGGCLSMGLTRSRPMRTTAALPPG